MSTVDDSGTPNVSSVSSVKSRLAPAASYREATTSSVFRVMNDNTASLAASAAWSVEHLILSIFPKYSQGRFCACAAENWLKIPEIVVQFRKCPLLYHIDQSVNGSRFLTWLT